MGYYTYFTLSYYGPPEDRAKLEHFNPHDYDFDCPDAIETLIDPDKYGAEDMKWYNWEKDMEKLAKMFPTILFILEGDGEDSDDIWEWRGKGDITEYHCFEMPPFTTPELINYKPNVI